MRYIGLIVVVVVLIGVLLWAVAYLGTRNKPRPLENANTATQIARHLDRIIVDPTLIGSTQWKDTAVRLLDDFYKGK